MSATLDRVKPGLDQANNLKPGQGWVGADVQAGTDVPLAGIIEAGAKINPSWAIYGDAWLRPTNKQIGADVAARFKDHIDLYAGGSADLDGHVAAEAGVKWNF